ncbi:hypothetical protein BaRGS_00020316 [Batillaria attramentaria]|uniref:CDAN1-interacting nuclease 1 n=1 Tax=Batillaria attramentaria TaxID=370345 RepID=A0ABD0KME9_9CAEN
MKKTHAKHTTPQAQENYYEQFRAKAEEKEDHIMVKMANKLELSPCMLARIILDKYLNLTGLSKEGGEDGGVNNFRLTISHLMRNPTEIDDPILAREVLECNVADEHYGPIVDSIKRSIGFEYEVKLKKWCDDNGLPFLGEDQMRLRGFDKTPDVKLEIPIAINGQVITWIESKASFGDMESHRAYMNDQFWCYTNRFGPGLVIYWFGYIEELDTHGEDGIMLSDRLPSHFVTMDLSI